MPDSDYITTRSLFQRLRVAHVRLRRIHGRIGQRPGLSAIDRILLNDAIGLVEKAVDLIALAAGVSAEKNEGR